MRLSLEAAPKGPLQQVLFFDLRKHGVDTCAPCVWFLSVHSVADCSYTPGTRVLLAGNTWGVTSGEHTGGGEENTRGWMWGTRGDGSVEHLVFHLNCLRRAQ